MFIVLPRLLLDIIVDSTVIFWAPQVQVGERAAFQVSLAAPTDIMISALPIAELKVLFVEGVKPVVIKHVSGSDSEKSVRNVDLGHIGPLEEMGDAPELHACLRWKPGDIAVFSGTMSSNTPCSFKVWGFASHGYMND
jgi:trafficking protein particle complex subunit 11